MKYVLNFFAVCVLLSLTACRSATDATSHIENNPLTWNVDQDTHIGDMVDTILYLPLETHKDGLIGHTTKMIMKNDKIYIFDRYKANSLTVFDDKGKFLFRAGKKGAGPGEYSLLWNFTVDSNYIYLLANSQKKIILYDLQGNFIEEKKIPFFADDIAVFDNGDYMFTYHYGREEESDRAGKYRIFFTDKKFNVTKELFRINETDSNLARDFYFSNFDDKIVYQGYVHDSIAVFSAKNGSFKTYSIDFGAQSVPYDKRRVVKDFNVGTYTYLSMIPPFMIGDNFIGIVNIGETTPYFIMDSKTGNARLNTTDLKKINNILMMPKTVNNGCIVSMVNGMEYQTLIGMGWTKAPAEVHKHLEDGDNITLLLYKLKQ